MSEKFKKPKTRNYSWRELVEKLAGPEEPVPVYIFPQRKFFQNPHRPYGPKR